MLSGYTENYIRVFVPYHPSLERSLAEVLLKERVSEGCIGVIKNTGLTEAQASDNFPGLYAVAQ